MSDRELLELAAKAAGYKVFWVDHEWVGGRDHIKQMLPDEYQHFIIGHNKKWNPINDDGDALRLAVKLHLLIDTCGMAARPLDDNIGWIDGDGETACQRVRSAITKVAAEIGRNMP